ncbi:MAG: hypothetical protein AB1416_06170, partial [Actinomycetota bacterium]
ARIGHGGATVAFETLATRRLGALPARGGTAVRPIPSAIQRIVTYDRRILRRTSPRNRDAVRAKIVDPSTVRRMVGVGDGRARVEVWTGLRGDGREQLFVTRGARRALLLSGGFCPLSPDTPAVMTCAVFGVAQPGGRTEEYLVIGRVSPDVAEVAISERGRRDQTVIPENGWFVARRSTVGPIRLVARDAAQRRVGSSRPGNGGGSLILLTT